MMKRLGAERRFLHKYEDLLSALRSHLQRRKKKGTCKSHVP